MITWKQKINPLWWFGNIDDPMPPDWYRTGQPLLWRTLTWYGRNPLHNFMFYVVGVHDKVFRVIASRPHSIDGAFADGGGWLFTRLDPYWWLPFVSYQGVKKQFYLGWSPAGKLGFAWRNK